MQTKPRQRHSLSLALCALLLCAPLAAQDELRQRESRQLLRQLGTEATPFAGDIEVTDIAGRQLLRESSAHHSSHDLQVLASDEQQLIVRPSSMVALQMSNERMVLPTGVLVRAPEATTESPVWLRPTIVASPIPVTWNTAERRYTTQIALGLQAPAEAITTNLDEPVVVRFGFRGMLAEPMADISLVRAGLEHEQQASLHFMPTTSAPVLELRSTLGDMDFALEVLPRIELRPLATSMAGFGLGSISVDVVHLLPHGAPAPVGEDTLVSLQVSGGTRPTPARLILPAGSAQAQFHLRSGGFGPTQVTATAGGLTDSILIQQEVPVLPPLAALLGGVIGGFSRRFQPGAGKGGSGARVLEGVLAAAVVYVASVIGVGLLSLPTAIAATEAGAFLVGVVGGFVGVALLETLTQRLRGSGRQPD